MRSYFKIYYINGVFYDHQYGLTMRTPDEGGNDQIFAITLIPWPHRKSNVASYLNQIVPLAATQAGAIAMSQLGFWDYETYHRDHPGG